MARTSTTSRHVDGLQCLLRSHRFKLRTTQSRPNLFPLMSITQKDDKVLDLWSRARVGRWSAGRTEPQSGLLTELKIAYSAAPQGLSHRKESRLG